MCQYIETGVCAGEKCDRTNTPSYKPKYKKGHYDNICKVKCPDGFYCTRNPHKKGDHEAHCGLSAAARWKV